MIEIDVVGDRIHLTSPYDPRIIAGCKRISGANWSKTARAWTFPLTMESCLRLRQEFGQDLRVRKTLSRWFTEEKAARQVMLSLNELGEAVPLPRVQELAPALYRAVTEVRRYQSRGAQFIVNGRNVILADDPGLGKTLEVLAAVIESGVPGPYLVVSPKTAATTVWPYEIPRWVPEANVIELPEGRAKRDAILNDMMETYKWPHSGSDLSTTWVSVHPEAVLTKSFWVCKGCGAETAYTRKPTSVLGCGHPKAKNVKIRDEHTFPQLFDIEWGVIVVDECHESLIVRSGTPTQRRRGLDLLRLREDGFKVASSGTPFRSKPVQLWGLLNWLWPKRYSGKWRWISQYWHLGGYSGFEVGDLIKDREKMLWNELGGIMLRRTKAEVAPDLPPKTYMGTPLDPSDEHSPVGIWLTMTPAQKKAYKTITEEGYAELERGRVTTVGVLAELTRLQQFASAWGAIDDKGDFLPSLPSNKFEWIEEFLETLGIPHEPTAKVIIASRYTRMLNMLSVGLKASQSGMSCRITGEETTTNRKRTIASFNEPVGSDSPHIMFMNIVAGGTAITIDSADHMVILDEMDPDSMKQLEDRIHRVSKPRPVFYYYLRSRESVDVGIAKVNADQSAEGQKLLDGRRGVEYFRKVLELSNG